MASTHAHGATLRRRFVPVSGRVQQAFSVERGRRSKQADSIHQYIIDSISRANRARTADRLPRRPVTAVCGAHVRSEAERMRRVRRGAGYSFGGGQMGASCVLDEDELASIGRLHGRQANKTEPCEQREFRRNRTLFLVQVKDLGRAAASANFVKAFR